MNIDCPIHKNTECVKLNSIFSTKRIIELYKSFYNIDTTNYFNSHNKISLFICIKTQYCFFYPKEIVGDQQFYEQLSKQNKYYLSWKWEYEQALKWISEKDFLLEIACGNGFFLKQASKKASYCVGIDLTANPFSENKINILKQDFISFIENNSLKFDVIVSFQFLEHIFDINEFFHYVSSILKPNGRLILAVPDNNSLIIKKEEVLNFPPHHMGWWTKKSLKNAGEFFGFKTVFSKTEPLQPYLINRRSYLKEVERIDKFGFLGKILNKLFHRISLFIYINFPTLFKGHSFIIVMDKK